MNSTGATVSFALPRRVPRGGRSARSSSASGRLREAESTGSAKKRAPHAITGTAVNNQRFPGQWFQLESALHYNWHRHYDPSLGRYTQPDPLGFVDGPSVYAYAGGSPLRWVDRDGRYISAPQPIIQTPKPPSPSDPQQCSCPPKQIGGGRQGEVGQGDECGPGGGGGGSSSNSKSDGSSSGGGGGGKTKPYGGPSEAQQNAYQKQLERDGPGSLEKSRKSAEENLEIHQRKLEQLQKDGGYTSSVEREIRNFQNEISVINSLLGK